MPRGYSVSLGSLAMGLVVLRGAIHGEQLANVAVEAIVALIVFCGVGWIAGWIMDYLVRDSIEKRFRSRVDWYRTGLVDAGFIESEDTEDA